MKPNSKMKTDAGPKPRATPGAAVPATARGASLVPPSAAGDATPLSDSSRDRTVAAARLHDQLQLVFPFPSLDFPGRATLTVAEIGEKLGWSEKHIANLIGDGELPCLDGKTRDASRGSFRVPLECYRDFITARLTGGRRLELLCLLPKATLRDLIRELSAFLERS